MSARDRLINLLLGRIDQRTRTADEVLAERDREQAAKLRAYAEGLEPLSSASVNFQMGLFHAAQMLTPEEGRAVSALEQALAAMGFDLTDLANATASVDDTVNRIINHTEPKDTP